jgi:Fe-S-cluster containining protein
MSQIENNMSEEQLEIALENARANSDRIIKGLPINLVKMEETLTDRIAKHKGNSFTKLEVLYSVMDKIYSFVNNYTACKKGCNHCCYYKASITELEIQYIEKTTVIKRLKNKLPKAEFHGIACPFLHNGSCSIYKSRPFVCRRHISTCETATWCHVDKCNTQSFPLLNFTEVDKSFHIIAAKIGQSEHNDIRQIFGYNIKN